MKHYLLKTFILPLMICPLLALAQTTDEESLWTLEDCINYAHDYNLTVQSAQIDVDISKADLKQSQLSRIPSINFNLFNSWRWGRSIDPTTNLFTNDRINSNGMSFASNMIVYNGNQQMNTIRQNQYNLQATEYDYSKIKNDISLMVVNGYLNVLLAKELLENANQQLSSTSAQLEQTTKMVEAGSLPVRNQLDLQSQKASNEVEVINGENNVQFRLLQLKQLLQIPASQSFDVITPEFEAAKYAMVEENPEEIYAVAEDTQPEIKSAELNIESSDMALRVAKGARIPALTVGANAQTNYSSANQSFIRGFETVLVEPMQIGTVNNDPTQPVFNLPFEDERPIFDDRYTVSEQWENNFAYSAGFNLAIPVFNGYSTSSNIQRAKLRKRQSEIRANDIRQTLRQTIETAYNDATAAIKVYEAAQKQVEALEESFRATEKSYKLGAVNYVDYQVSSFNFYTAQSDLLRAKYDYIFKLKILDFYMGNPLTLD